MDSPVDRWAAVHERDFVPSLDKVRDLGRAVARVFVGKEQVVGTLLTGFIAGLHILIEDVPGVGKTTLARALAAGAGLDFARIQFTPDLLPGDILGVSIWSPEQREFVFKQGAIMHQFILADEINRASPRTQSSLLEAMQEGTVSVDGHSHPLPRPFFVLATQNPQEHAGVFPLPESELDRFGLSFSLGYPAQEEERDILRRFRSDDPLKRIEPVISPEELIQVRRLVRAIHISDALLDLIIHIVQATRQNRRIRLGASPRASQHLQVAAQARAVLAGREFVIPEDIVELAVPVLAHRVIPTAESRAAGLHSADLVRLIVQESRLPTGLR